MIITHLNLKNWRNFREANIPLRGTSYLLGANASGKSNLLDVFRFMRDLSTDQGGGLQKAIADRGGLKKLRCLHARRDPEVSIEITLADSAENPSLKWKYVLSFKSEGTGAQRPLISKEEVWKDDKLILNRPNKDDKGDIVRLTQTHLEQIQTNVKFREISNFLSEVTYLHLVPQLLKHGDMMSIPTIENDPFGQGFLERVAKTTARTRDARLKKIETALSYAVPQFKQLEFVKDEVTGRPHLQARYAHHRPKAGWQREEQFSDGTLRLIGLLWSLQESTSLLLLEEPELSLNDAVVEQIPGMIQRIQNKLRRKRQIIISTHSQTLLDNPGIDGRGVILLEQSNDGTKARALNQDENNALMDGFSISEVALPKTRPSNANQMSLG